MQQVHILFLLQVIVIVLHDAFGSGLVGPTWFYRSACRMVCGHFIMYVVGSGLMSWWCDGCHVVLADAGSNCMSLVLQVYCQGLTLLNSI